MADDFEHDRTEAPTPRRRREAREEGHVARSSDLSSALLLLGLLVTLQVLGPRLLESWRRVAHLAMGEAELARTSPELAGMAGQIIFHAAAGVLPLLGVAMVLGILVNLAQTGFLFVPGRLAPRLSHLDPVEGATRIFLCGRTWAGLLMNLSKIAVAGIAGWLAVRSALPEILSLPTMDAAPAVAAGASAVVGVGLKLAVALVALAILDFGWQRWMYERQLRMTRQEVKDELRRTEGDVQIKARRRQPTRLPAFDRMSRAVKSADVVVTAAGELALALKYDPASMSVARLVARGTGKLSIRMVELAAEGRVPVVESAPLAHGLQRNVEVDGEIPEDQFTAVAELLAYARRI